MLTAVYINADDCSLVLRSCQSIRVVLVGHYSRDRWKPAWREFVPGCIAVKLLTRSSTIVLD